MPETEVTSASLDAILGLTLGTIERASGVQTRRVCASEDQIDLAVAAATRAIEDAAVNPGDIDLILAASAVPYQTIPTTAPLILRRLGLRAGEVTAFDVNATCLSFVAALDVAAARITLGQSRLALIVSSEVPSRALPWKDQPEVAALFGDGAAAALVARAQPGQGGIRASLMRTYSAAYEASTLVSGGTRLDFHADPEAFTHNAVFRMDGPALFKITHRHFPGFVAQLLTAAGWQPGDVDLVVPHQASPLALEHMIRATGLPEGLIVNIARHLGNQVAASIPTALDIARHAGRTPAGTRLLLLGTSAGVSFGGMAIEM